MSPLVAHLRHVDQLGKCLLAGVFRKSRFRGVRSEFDPNRAPATPFLLTSPLPGIRENFIFLDQVTC